MTDPAELKRVQGLVCRPWVAALVVLAIYGALALLNSTGGYLGTDTGAKVATVDAMADAGTLSPAVGYWAEQWDPEGTYHPLLDTVQNDDGEWINVTTLPMLVLATPLYELGGYRLALVWPMLGAVLAAFACRDIAQQLGGESAGWRAFWLTALASPIPVYALDLWEHSVGAALMVGSFAILLRVVRRAWTPWAGAGAGVLLGAAAAMRTEAFVVAFVFVAACCLHLAWRRRWGPALIAGASAVAGFGVPWLLNGRLESALGGNRRADRAAGVARTDWWTELPVRIKEAGITWFGLPGAEYPGGVLLGVIAVGTLVFAAHLARRGEARIARLAVGVAAACLVIGFSGGLAFVSGAFITAPIAAFAVLNPRWDPLRTHTLLSGLGATFLIWMFQFTGGAGPQWGGRYILAPTLLLLALGAVSIGSVPQPVRRAAVGIAALVAVVGGVWLWHRSHGVDEFFERLAERPEDVIVSTNGFLVREAGPAYADRRYLSVGRQGDLDGAVEVVERAGLRDLAVLTQDPEPPRELGAPRSTSELELLGVPFFLYSYSVPG